MLLCLAGNVAAAPASTPPAASTPATASTAARRVSPPPLSYNSGRPSHRLSADPAKVNMELRPGGIRVYHLNGQGMQTLTAYRGADGKIRLRCNDQAAQAPDAPPPPPADARAARR